MSTQVLTPHASAPPDKKSPFLPIEVLVIALGDSIVVYPSNLRIRWGYEGTIVWHLATNEALDFAKPGVVFDDVDAPFGPVTSDKPGQCQLSLKNTDPGSKKTGTQFRYNIALSDPSGKTLKFDPVVENDPPTP
jgi:hypothetical protein